MSAGGSNISCLVGHRIQFCKGTNEKPFNPSLAQNGASSFREDLNFFFHKVNLITLSADGSQLGWRAGSSDIIPKEDHLRTILSKLKPCWLLWLAGRLIGYNCEGRTPNYHSHKVWSQLA